MQKTQAVASLGQHKLMLPAWVKVVCVDINPATVTKLSDRGSAQATGIVTDIGLFLEQLAQELTGYRSS